MSRCFNCPFHETMTPTFDIVCNFPNIYHWDKYRFNCVYEIIELENKEYKEQLNND